MGLRMRGPMPFIEEGKKEGVQGTGSATFRPSTSFFFLEGFRPVLVPLVVSRDKLTLEKWHPVFLVVLCLFCGAPYFPSCSLWKCSWMVLSWGSSVHGRLVNVDTGMIAAAGAKCTSSQASWLARQSVVTLLAKLSLCTSLSLI
ncbi:hypothetical protein K470DRAFT_22286 [Piedraia hortae CBS 480.64]|uniref:Uncharacterized protein n=1 Tax=Piedraia hortae CBS 480.64 TaxID=1314780 RepID=A0A6A7C533_9PEZI|nr:hypothetical protein K470DRAFT_22286 [Piedraia hortae CBS 480.64]